MESMCPRDTRGREVFRSSPNPGVAAAGAGAGVGSSTRAGGALGLGGGTRHATPSVGGREAGPPPGTGSLRAARCGRAGSGRCARGSRRVRPRRGETTPTRTSTTTRPTASPPAISARRSPRRACSTGATTRTPPHWPARGLAPWWPITAALVSLGHRLPFGELRQGQLSAPSLLTAPT